MSDKSDKKIFVANLPNEINEEELENIFSKYGKIVETTIKQKAGKFAFIEFQDEQMAKDSLEEDGKEIQGRKIRVEISQKKERNDYNRDSRGGYDRDRYNNRDSRGGYDRDSRYNNRDRDRDSRGSGYNRDRNNSRDYDRRGSQQDRPRGCFNCGDEGHKKFDCPKPQNSRRDDRGGDRYSRGGGRDNFRGGDRGMMKCFNCDRVGHKKQDCREPMRNGGDRRYNNYRRNSRSRSRSDSRGGSRNGYNDRNNNYKKRQSPSYEKRSYSKESRNSRSD